MLDKPTWLCLLVYLAQIFVWVKVVRTQTKIPTNFDVEDIFDEDFSHSNDEYSEDRHDSDEEGNGDKLSADD